jgi:hypothetical protein
LPALDTRIKESLRSPLLHRRVGIAVGKFHDERDMLKEGRSPG